MISMFREITDRKKIVLFIDDMQWMDDLSRQLLWRLVLELEGKFCFIATYRTGEEERNLDFLRRAERRELVRFIKLMPFTEEETAEIIGNEIPSASAGMMASKIWQRTEGNALFLMDLLNMIRDEGWDSGSIPPKSEYIIRARLRNITPVQKQILCALSIFMEHAELYELEILVDMDRLSLCEELEALETEITIAVGLIEDCIKENAHVALDQAEYQKRYDGLVARFDKAKARHTEVTDLIAERTARRHQIETYLKELRGREPLTEFRDSDWLAMVDYITVHSKKGIRVTFKDGTEIKA